MQLLDNVLIFSVSVTLAFTSTEAHVGITLPYQVVLQSHARPATSSLYIETIDVVFEGTFKTVNLQHDDTTTHSASSKSTPFSIQDVALEETPSELGITSRESSSSSDSGDSLYGKADLSLPAGVTKVLCLKDVPREPGEIMASKITVNFKESKFDVQIAITMGDQLQRSTTFQSHGNKFVQSPLFRDRSCAIRVLPKPPRLRLALSATEQDLFVDETRTLSLDVINEEDEVVDLTLQLQFPNEGDRGPSVFWKDEDAQGQSANDEASLLRQQQKLAGHLLPSTSQSHDISLKTGSQISEHILQIKATYFVKSDPKTQIFVALEKELVVHRPFECTHKFSPLVHPQEWPHYFHLGDSEQDGEPGLTHRYLLISQLMTVSNLKLFVESIEAEVCEVQEAAHCNVIFHGEQKAEVLAPGDVKDLQFTVDIQKNDVEDRRPTYVDLRLKVTWRPDIPHQPSMITYHSVPELAIPFGEPRVLATSRSVPTPPGAIKLSYLIENPSIYSLQFNVMMDISEEFAFSGPKNLVVQLLPLNRQSIDFVLLPLVKGTWITPQLRVYDVMFHKQLKIQGAEGVRNDKKGTISVWIDAPD